MLFLAANFLIETSCRKVDISINLYGRKSNYCRTKRRKYSKVTRTSYIKDNSEQELLISRTIQNKDISYQGQFRQEHLITRKILNEDNSYIRFRKAMIHLRTIRIKDKLFQDTSSKENWRTRGPPVLLLAESTR